MGKFRWDQAALDAFEKRSQEWKKERGVTVRTHICRDEKPLKNMKPLAVRSAIEAELEKQFSIGGLKGFETQFKPLLPRKWSLDFAWPDRKVAVEVQGMVHRIKDKFRRDIEKRAELMLAGWKVLEVDGASVRDGRAFEWVTRLLKGS